MRETASSGPQPAAALNLSYSLQLQAGAGKPNGALTSLLAQMTDAWACDYPAGWTDFANIQSAGLQNPQRSEIGMQAVSCSSMPQKGGCSSAELHQSMGFCFQC